MKLWQVHLHRVLNGTSLSSIRFECKYVALINYDTSFFFGYDGVLINYNLRIRLESRSK